jgi:hypothetical protein
MKLSNAGNNTTAAVEVVHVSKHGFWLNIDGEELFLSFGEFPWFETAPLHSIFDVELRHGFHLCWPDLDIDLEVDSIRHPEKYPLHFDPIQPT